ncbi:uncharacterized protein LOC116214544 [Punica granatum]|uniref:Uncharacterized protein LOC116214544 n=1 Tax=Punica granatum TaxID=22663 RepID=A0A6P8E738_PUNGR|nr:uncharacterized protein LOC116214544 [Punica granatum]
MCRGLVGRLRILDKCGTLQEILSQMKESTSELESSLRRRGSCVIGIVGFVIQSFVAGIVGFLIQSFVTVSLYKRPSSAANKIRLERQNILRQDSEEEAALSILKEVEMMSIDSVFKSLLCFLWRPGARSNNRSFVSKVLSSKQVLGKGAPEVEDLDVELLVLKRVKKAISKEVELLESSIQEIEEVCGCFWRAPMKINESFPCQHHQLLRQFCSL